jgi:hypothetical protein
LKKAAGILALFIFALSLSAQLRTGQVQGQVVNKEGRPLAGVKVTLSRPRAADQKTVTGPSGIFHFPAVVPAEDYSLRAELAEFKIVNRPGLAVSVGGHTPVTIVLEPGKPGEEVTVATPSPGVDRARFTSGASFGWMALQTLPTARDPWVIVQLVPSVLVDRENVGGNESSQQSGFVTKGDDSNGQGNSWAVDGIPVTDPVSLGFSDINYDFDAIDTMSVTTGGAADVVQQTRGIAVNLLTRRGGNQIGGTARFYMTDSAFQTSNLTDELRSQGVTNTNRIEQIRDYGANVGGPIVKNRVWFWGAYGVQDLFTYTIYNYPDRTLFQNYSLKLDAEPIRGNRLEAMTTTSQYEKFGANASLAKPEGDHRTGRFHLGSPIYKFQDEQTFGNNLYLSLKLTKANTGATTKPMVDEQMTSPVVYDVAQAIYVPFSSEFGRSWDHSQIVRGNNNLQLLTTLYRDRLFGMAHEFKAGLEFSHRKATSTQGYPQNYEVFRNFTEPLIDLGAGLVVPPSDWQRFVLNRENAQDARAEQSSAFLQDTITKGRFTFQLGLRYDSQRPSTGAYSISTVLPSWTNIFTNDAITAMANYLPSLTVDAIHPNYAWSTWSPRIGVSWDLKGDGRTILKLSLAQYGDVLAAGANVPEPLGLTGNLAFWWKDANASSTVNNNEIYWQYSAVHPETPNQLYLLVDENGNLTEEAYAALLGGFEGDAYAAGNYWDYDFLHPEVINYDSQTTFFRSDMTPSAKNVKTSPRTREVMLSLEKELRTDLTASIAATYRRYDNFDWSKLFYPADIYPSTPDLVIDNTTGPWYEPAGTIPASITLEDDTVIDLGDAGGRTWYLPSASFPGNTPYRMVDKSSGHRTYLGLDLGVTKRLSNRWFMNASATLQDQRLHWGDSYLDPTNQWAIDGKPYGNMGGGAGGKVGMQMYSRWMVKLSGLYQLPLGFDFSATLLAREGWKIPHYITLAYADPASWPGLYRSNVVYVQTPTKDSLSTLSNLSLRLEKRFNLGTSGRLYLMADFFNVLNRPTVNRAYDAYYGTYYVDTETFVANPSNRRYNEILNPRVMRLGLRFEF